MPVVVASRPGVSRSVVAIPTGSAAAPVVKICCKSLNRAEKVIQRAVARGRDGGARERQRVRGGALLLGPLACGWTTWFTKYGGPTELKWSKCGSAASRHVRRRLIMRDGRWCGTLEPPPTTGLTASATPFFVYYAAGPVGRASPASARSMTPTPARTPTRRAVADRASAPFDRAGPARAPPDPRAGAPVREIAT